MATDVSGKARLGACVLVRHGATTARVAYCQLMVPSALHPAVERGEDEESDREADNADADAAAFRN